MVSDCSTLIGQYYSVATLPLVRMPPKGKYLLNEQQMKQETLYRKFSGISQYQPFVLLLGLSMLTCVTLLVLFFSLKLVRYRIYANALIQYACLHTPTIRGQTPTHASHYITGSTFTFNHLIMIWFVFAVQMVSDD